MTDTTIKYCTSTNGSGGFLYAGVNMVSTKVTVTDSNFESNTAGNSGNGGTFYLGATDTNTISIDTTTITNYDSDKWV